MVATTPQTMTDIHTYNQQVKYDRRHHKCQIRRGRGPYSKK